MCNDKKICSCFGHLNVSISGELRDEVERTVSSAIEDGVRVFLFGGLSDFDELVYDVVTDIKARDPSLDISRVFCFAQDRDLSRPRSVKREYEAYECPSKACDWWYKAIYFRNCAMIDKSDLVLFFAERKENSGAYKAYRYALKAKKKTVNFARV